MSSNFQTKKFAAFISYRHLSPDRYVAHALQFLLEHNMVRPDRKTPRHIRPVFLDTSELPTLESLDEGILEALRNSDCLYVICSPNLPLSKYCMREISYFKEIHGGSLNRIFTILVDGDPESAFPRQLRFQTVRSVGENGEILETEEPVEPLFSDVRSKTVLGAVWKLFHKEYIRLAAAYFQCSFDSLYQRHRRFRAAIAALVLAAAAAAGVSVHLYGETLRANAIMSRTEEVLHSDDELLALTMCSYADSFAARTFSPKYRDVLTNAVVQHDMKLHMPISRTHLANYLHTEVTTDDGYVRDNTVWYLSESGQQILVLDDNMLQITDARTGEIYLRTAADRVSIHGETPKEYFILRSHDDGQGKIMDYVSLFRIADNTLITEFPYREASPEESRAFIASAIEYPDLNVVMEGDRVVAYFLQDGTPLTEEEFIQLSVPHLSDEVPEDDDPYFVRRSTFQGSAVIDRDDNVCLSLGRGIENWAFSPDWKQFACTDGERLYVFSTEDWTQIGECTYPAVSGGNLMLLHGSSYFAIHTRDSGLKTIVCDWHTGKKLAELPGYPKFSPTEQAFYTACFGKITRYDYCPQDLRNVSYMAAAKDSRVLSRNGSTLEFLSGDTPVWEAENCGSRDAAWDDDLRHLLVAGEDRLTCLDSSGNTLWSVPEKAGCTALSADGSLAAWADSAGSIHVAEVPSGKEVRVISPQEHGQSVRGLEVSAGGICITGSSDVLWLPTDGNAVSLGQYSRARLHADGVLILEEKQARVDDFAVYQTKKQERFRPDLNTGIWAYSPKTGYLIRHLEESGHKPSDKLEILKAGGKLVGTITLPSKNVEALYLDSSGEWISVVYDGITRIYQADSREKWMEISQPCYFESGRIQSWEVYGQSFCSFRADDWDHCAQYAGEILNGSWHARTLSEEEIQKYS